MRGRSVSILVTFGNNVPKSEIYDYFDSFGKEIYVTEIPNLMMKRYTVEVPEEKARDYVDKFKASEDVLSAYLNEQEMNRPKTDRFFKSDKKTDKNRSKSK